MKAKLISFLSIKTVVLLVLVAFIFTPSHIEAQKKTLPIGESLVIHSDILNQDREVLVYRPNYQEGFGKNIPVLYVLDGGAHFHYITGIVSYLSGQGVIPPVIVVAIKNINRNIDFSPIPIDGLPGSGGAKAFQKFIAKELMPMIAEKYYVADYSVLMGHSLGGTFATYSLLSYPNVFDSYISVSPYLQFGEGYLIEQTEKFLKSAYDSEKKMFMTLGDEPAYYETHDAFKKIIKERDPKNFHMKYVSMDKENHGTTPLLSVYYGLEFIFNDWQLPKTIESVWQLDKQNQILAEKYGMEIQSDEQTINLLGYKFLQAGELDKAIETFKENIKRYPESANVYDSMGDAYKNNKEFDKAKKNYSKAVKIGMKQNHPYLQAYQKNLEGLEKKGEGRK